MTQPWRTAMPGRPRVPLPPGPMPWRHGTRPLKRWRWVGVFDTRVLLCAATIRIGGLPVSWWAVWDRGSRTLAERTRRGRGCADLSSGRLLVSDGPVAIDLTLAEPAGAAVETVSPHGGSGYAWTRKLAGAGARGTVRIGEREHVIDGRAVIDDSAGYHARDTRWLWSAGTGRDAAGAPVAWNLCSGQHDDPRASENTVWVGGIPHAVAPVRFDGLAAVCFASGERLLFTPEATRAHSENRLVIASEYEAPFGSFSGTLPHIGALTAGLGVMERHSARW